MKRKLFKDNPLIHAVVNCDYNAVKHTLSSSDYDKSCLTDIGGFSKNVPLFILSKCYKIILNPKDYTEDIDPFLKSKNEDNNKILNLFDKQFDFYNLIIEDFSEDFYETEEDMLEKPEANKTFEEFYISEGFDKFNFQKFRTIDLRLYYAVIELRSYYEIKKCCNAGANPEVALPEMKSPIEYVNTDILILFTDVVHLLKKQKKDSFDIYDIINIIWCARHQQNYNLMLQYCNSF